MPDPVRFSRPATDRDMPMTLTVQSEDGNWTEGPCAIVEVGNAIELSESELAWLVEDAGPQALALLREMAT